MGGHIGEVSARVQMASQSSDLSDLDGFHEDAKCRFRI